MSTKTFVYTGAEETWDVPAGVTEITVDVQGAQGAALGTGNLTPRGGRVQTVLAVTPGETLSVFVGGQGTSAAAGFNGGGAPGAAFVAAGGGGASDVRQGGNTTADRVIVAGGGGGSSNYSPGYPPGAQTGGSGGGTTGGAGGTGPSGGGGGQPGTASAGGAGGVANGGTAGEDGETDGVGQGGDGVGFDTGEGVIYSAGGGGGYFGGGGGGANGNYGAGGGGGSSFADGGVTSGTVHTQGYRSGNGLVVFEYQVTIDVTVVVPQPDDVIIEPPVNVDWSLTNGSLLQNDYRVRVFLVSDDSLVYDSGQVADIATALTIAGSIFVTGTDYYLNVEVNDSEGGHGLSDDVPFTVAWTPPPAVSVSRVQGISEENVNRP